MAGGFKSFIIQKDEHLLAVLRYIESNPIRAGLTESAKAWNWSSHTEASGERPRDLIDECLMELPADWQKYVDTPFTGKELERIRKSVIDNPRMNTWGSRREFLMESYIVRIYRREEVSPQNITDTVEEVGVEGMKPFHSLIELTSILREGGSEPGKVKKKRSYRRKEDKT